LPPTKPTAASKALSQKRTTTARAVPHRQTLSECEHQKDDDAKDRDGKLAAQSADLRTMGQFLEMLNQAGLR
jgi:hypothetical protein